MARRRCVWVLLLAGLALGLGVGPRTSVLQVTNTQDGHLCLCRRMGKGELFELAFTHSVNKGPVFETLKAQGDHLVIVGARYDAFGAGMPESTTADGVFSRRPDGWLEWTVNRPVPEVVVRVGRVAGHTLTLKGQSLPLSGLAPPGSALAFTIKKVSFFRVMKDRCRG